MEIITHMKLWMYFMFSLDIISTFVTVYKQNPKCPQLRAHFSSNLLLLVLPNLFNL